MLYSESYVQDLIDSGEFQEEAEKGIDVPFYELEVYELQWYILVSKWQYFGFFHKIS